MASRFSIILLLFVSLCFPLPLRAISPAVPDRPGSHVVDLASVIEEPVKERLEALLRELEQKTTAQIVVLTVGSLEGEPIERASLDIAHTRWSLGKKGKDNGVLLLVEVPGVLLVAFALRPDVARNRDQQKPRDAQVHHDDPGK
ncbi:MAG: TPM domain-containing protein, partial [Thermodesulfovibrionales bacterium]